MDPSYEDIVEFKDRVWTLAVYLLHGGMVFVHAGLACFLIGSGVHNLLGPDRDGKWLRRLDAHLSRGARHPARGYRAPEGRRVRDST